MKVGDMCRIWDPDIGSVFEESSWVYGIVVRERVQKSELKFQVMWSNSGLDKTWYCEMDICLDNGPV